MELTKNIVNTFNNREWSILIWVSLFLLWAISRKEIRDSFHDVLRAFFQIKIIIPTALLAIYAFGSIVLLSKIGYWEYSLLKDTVIWFLGVAFIMLVNSVKASEEDGYFKKVIIDNFKLIIIFQFVVNTYVFSLPLELAITPVSTILIMASVFSEKKTEYQSAHKIIQFILFVIGSCFLMFSFSKLFGDINNFLLLDNLKKLLLTPLLTIILLPFIYMMAVYILYETIFVVLSIKEYWKDNLKHIKIQLITTCKLSRKRLNFFRKIMHDFDLSTKEGVALAMQKIKS